MIDYRDTPPVWVRYLTYVGGSSDKYYELRIDLDDRGRFEVTKRWGRNPDKGKGQIQSAGNLSNLNLAINVANHAAGEKMREGYREIERPGSANGQVV